MGDQEDGDGGQCCVGEWASGAHMFLCDRLV